MVIPEIAFEPDIKGVCNCDGTFEISSNPRKAARTKMKIRMAIINGGAF
jgi:hypothetical protein